MRILTYPAAVFGLLVASTSIASAHVIVTPKQVGVAEEQVFSVAVPSEEQATTIALRLVMPSGLSDVMPTVQAGWNVTAKHDAQGNVTELDWVGGGIPSGDRDDFTFQAQAPATATTLDWRAYQTYSNGKVVSWDQTPVPGHADDDSMTPYSTTAVINDLAAGQPAGIPAADSALAVAATGLMLAVVALARRTRR